MNKFGIKGPRPISLHIANSKLIWEEAAKVGSSVLEQDIWHEGIADRLQALRQKMAALHAGAAPGEKLFDRSQLDAVITARAVERKNSFIRGVNKYVCTPFLTTEDRPSTQKKFGCVTLHDFGCGSDEGGQPILMVPSLVNPFYIMDLMPDRSLVRYLQENGYRPFLVDWGSPGEEERGFDVSDYILQRYQPILEHVVEIAGGPIPLVGYCMGGTLSVALASRAQGMLSKLVLLAAPWNFETKKMIAGRQNASEMQALVEQMLPGADVGVDMLQTFFTNVDPTLSDKKFRAYDAGKYQGSDAEFFSAMEVWSNNGPTLAKQVAHDCLGDWYKDNLPYSGKWLVAGKIVKPQNIDCPVWVAAPKGDRLVPQESAFALVGQLVTCETHEPPSGHIGMMVGNRARWGLWEPMLNWLNS